MVNFRKACMADIDRIAEIYDELHEAEETGRAYIGWIRGIYPTRETAEAAVMENDMFVGEDDGCIVAAGRINQCQCPEYKDAEWKYDVPDDEVMVFHTLVVSPAVKGRAFGTEFVAFYEKYALEHGCRYLRMDTNEKNKAARSLYRRLGYDEVSIVPTTFNGIPDVNLVCLEKRI